MNTLILLLVCYLILFIKPSTQSELCEALASSNNTISSACLQQMETLCNNGTLWWKMVDASSKYPYSGMSYSNNKDLGNYDECININEDNVQGKYCAYSLAIVNLFLDGIPDPFKLSAQPKILAQHKNVQVRDDLDEVSISALSLCVPNHCTPKEVGQFFFVWGQIDDLVPIVNFVDTVPCMTKDSNTDFRWGDILFTTFLAIILLLLIASTVYDLIISKMGQKPRHPLFIAFSLMTNGKKLVAISTSKSPNQISCLNGIRFISMMWVIAGHGFVTMEQVPLVNYEEIRSDLDGFHIMYAAAAPIAVDAFFFLSGFLLCFNYLKSSTGTPVLTQINRIPMMVVHRYLRLTPAVAVLYFAVITIYRMLGNGPLWDMVGNIVRIPCEDNWWTFFLYIQNYYNYDNLCMTHTWYLSADMQMFILAPIVLIPVTALINKKKRNLVIWALLGLICFWVVVPMGIRFADHNIQNTYDTHSRFNDYLIGVLLGVIMRDPRFGKFPFHKLVNLAIWCFVLVTCALFILCYHSIVRVYYHPTDTLFYGLYRPVWCFSLAWMTYSCYHGYGGPVNWFLSLPAFQVGARLSYCMYLLHALVEMYFLGLIRTSYYWGHYLIFYVWCGHFIVTMILSAVWSLAFESPMIAIEKVIFGQRGGKKQTKA